MDISILQTAIFKGKTSAWTRLLMLYLLFSLTPIYAKAQIRLEGQLRVGKVNQIQIESAIEDAYKNGLLKSNIDIWIELMQGMIDNKLRKEDSASFNSLRANGYYYGRTGNKYYLIFNEAISTFFLTTVVNCESFSSPQNGSRCELGIITIRPLSSGSQAIQLPNKMKKYYINKLFDYLICEKRLVI